MAKRPIDVQVSRPFRASLKAAWVRKVALEGLAAGDPRGLAGASVVVTDDATLRELNGRFRGFDEVTDVLSFGADGELAEASLEVDQSLPPFPDIPELTPSLGEVILSYPQAARQADEHLVEVEQEVALLIVHGMLHLLGHDHAEPDEEAVMKALEQQALVKLFPQPVPAGG